MWGAGNNLAFMRIGDGNGCFQDYPDGPGWRTVCEIGIEFYEIHKKTFIINK